MSNEVQYKDLKISRINRGELTESRFLRDDHIERLLRERSGCLRPLTVASANLYSTFNEEEILDIFADGDYKTKQSSSCKGMASQLAHTGVMVIPYPSFDDNDLSGRNWRRMRTDRVNGKYLSPLGEYSPPYRVVGFDNPDMLERFKEEIINEVIEENVDERFDSDYIKELGKDILNISKFDEVKGGIKNNKLPLVVVEGELKALAIFDAWLDRHKKLISNALRHEDPEAYMLTMNVEENFTCLGIGGVWNMIKKDKARVGEDTRYLVRPEWKEEVNMKDREFLICFDSDSKWIPSVGHAASCLAKSVSEEGAKVKYVQIPSARGKKYGADDYMLVYGSEALLQTFKEAEPIAAGVKFNDIKNAHKDGISPVDYLINLKREELTQELENTNIQDTDIVEPKSNKEIER